jgi:DNA-binding transcriptional ArsR family regulator
MDIDLDLIDPTIARALAHPLRALILAAMEEGPASPKEIAASLGEPLGKVSYHVQILRDLGLIALVRETRRRGAIEHHYAVNEPPKRRAPAWDIVPRSARRAAAPQYARDVAEGLTAAAAAGGFDRASSRIRVSQARVDAQGWKEIARELDALSSRLKEIEDESHARSPEGDPAVIDAVVVSALAEKQVNRRDGSARQPARSRRAP